MSIPTPKIEIGVDANSSISPFLRLDSLETGILDNNSAILGGASVFYDITNRVRNYSVSRGKGRTFSQFTTGQATIEFNNHDRTFDPQYNASPLAGQIVPRREVRISADDSVVFTGWVDDWNLSYLSSGDSIAQATCYDGFSILAGQQLTAGTPTAELSGARISNILDNSSVNWSGSERNIQDGIVTMGNQEIADGTNALTYLQKISQSEQGLFFIAKNGYVTFIEQIRQTSFNSLTQFNQTDGIPFRNLAVAYGSELLFNNVTAANVGGGTAVVADLDSQSTYGIRSYSATDLLAATDQDSVNYALSIADQYSTPKYRFDSLEVVVNKLSESQKSEILELELGSIVQITFTPNGIGDPISQYAEIINIEHTVTPELHVIGFSFDALTKLQFVLDDLIFGRLDNANALGVAENSWTLNDLIYGRLSAGMAVS